MSLDGTEHLGRDLLLADAVERDETARQGVPLLSPLAGPVPDVDHLGQALTALLEVPVQHQEPTGLGSGEGAHPPVARRTGQAIRSGEGGKGGVVVVAGGEPFGHRRRCEIGRATGASSRFTGE